MKIIFFFGILLLDEDVTEQLNHFLVRSVSKGCYERQQLTFI